jgi:hypothetical protein
MEVSLTVAGTDMESHLEAGLGVSILNGSTLARAGIVLAPRRFVKNKKERLVG